MSLETNEFTERNKMKILTKQLWLTCVATVCWMYAAVAADIHYVADNGGGE